MSFLNKFTIRTRLLIGVVLPVLITAGIIAWITANQIQTNGEAELERLEAELLETHKQGLTNLVESARAIMLEAKNNAWSEEEAKAEARSRMRSVIFDETNYIFVYDRELNNLAYAPDPSREVLTTDSDTRSLLNNIFRAAERNSFHEYDWVNPATGNVEPKVSYAMIVPEWDWMVGAGVYVTDVQAVLDETEQEIAEAMARALSFILMVTVAVIIAAVFIGMMVGRTVTVPLRQVSDMMREIADGDGDLRHRLPEDGNDELAVLGKRFNHFVIKIQNTVREVGATTDQVASAAEELSSVATETRQSVQEQGSETDQIASAINEMATTIQQIAGNANEVEGAASDADRMAREGGDTMSSAQVSVNHLSEEIESTAKGIDALAEKSGDIQQVLDVIHAVTEQTNLLALNAAIEAARAGEHGRGFSVVADEVRQLAKRSAESADQIREMIDGFVQESKASVERMSHSRKSSEETVERINHATNALSTIVGSVGHIHDQVTQIATAAEQQSQVAEEINQNVVRIVDAAQRSDTGVTQTNEASQELARLGEHLRELVGQFKV